MATKKETGRNQEQQILEIYESLAPSQKYAFVLGRIYALLKVGNDISDSIQEMVDMADKDLKNLDKKPKTIERKTAPKKSGVKKNGK